jgi:maleylacetoacetate isomerase
MAILDYLETAYPDPAFLPADPVAAAQVRAAAMVVACDIHPVNNLKVVQKLKGLGHSQDEAVQWMNDWMTAGFAAFEALVHDDTPFCFGDAPGLADLCLVPQLYNAHRWGCDLTPFKRLTEIETRCLALPAFDAARPETQPDAE